MNTPVSGRLGAGGRRKLFSGSSKGALGVVGRTAGCRVAGGITGSQDVSGEQNWEDKTTVGQVVGGAESFGRVQIQGGVGVNMWHHLQYQGGKWEVRESPALGQQGGGIVPIWDVLPGHHLLSLGAIQATHMTLLLSVV